MGGDIDIAFSACHYLAKALASPRHAPPSGLDQLMNEGKRGLRERQGYYDWRTVDVEDYREIAYWFGSNRCWKTVMNGSIAGVD